MYKYLSEEKKVREFEKPKTNPTRIDQPDTTGLSSYFKFGSVSIRLFYWELQKILENSKHSKPPESLLGQIYFREWFYLCSYTESSTFDKMVGNPHCKQIEWNYDNKLVDLWARGQTGYPAIDATMRQLVQEGWIHHLARHLVASFFTRGHLFQDWQIGITNNVNIIRQGCVR